MDFVQMTRSRDFGHGPIRSSMSIPSIEASCCALVGFDILQSADVHAGDRGRARCAGWECGAGLYVGGRSLGVPVIAPGRLFAGAAGLSEASSVVGRYFGPSEGAGPARGSSAVLRVKSSIRREASSPRRAAAMRTNASPEQLLLLLSLALCLVFAASRNGS